MYLRFLLGAHIWPDQLGPHFTINHVFQVGQVAQVDVAIAENGGGAIIKVGPGHAHQNSQDEGHQKVLLLHRGSQSRKIHFIRS
jgi:hypothetical protein